MRHGISVLPDAYERLSRTRGAKKGRDIACCCRTTCRRDALAFLYKCQYLLSSLLSIIIHTSLDCPFCHSQTLYYTFVLSVENLPWSSFFVPQKSITHCMGRVSFRLHVHRTSPPQKCECHGRRTLRQTYIPAFTHRCYIRISPLQYRTVLTKIHTLATHTLQPNFHTLLESHSKHSSFISTLIANDFAMARFNNSQPRSVAPNTNSKDNRKQSKCRATQLTPSWSRLQPGEPVAMDIEFQDYIRLGHTQTHRVGRVAIVNIRGQTVSRRLRCLRL